MLPTAILSLLIAVATASRVLYTGHKLLSVVPSDDSQFHFLDDLQRRADDEKIDVWRYCSGIGRPLDIRVPPENFETTRSKLRAHGLEVKVVMEDVQDYIDRQMAENTRMTSMPREGFDYSVYHNLSNIQRWVTDTVAQYESKFDIEEIQVATSFEGRNITGLRFTSKEGTSPKPIFWFHGGIHAREWISPATVIYMTGQLLDAYDTDPEVKAEVDAWEFYVVPVLNVDGYVFTWTKDRMWRKTRTHHLGCVGVDPNRNWDNHWCEEGSSKLPCSDTYCGPKVFSEPCTKGVSDYLLARKGSIKAFIDFHSYSQLWMTPWGYTTKKPADFDAQDASSIAAVNALQAVHGTQYEHGPIATTIYVASGNTVDWAYQTLGAKYSTAVELRDQGQYGFVLPPDQIIPSGEETLKAVLAFIKYARENP